jgi:hypothetical protein
VPGGTRSASRMAPSGGDLAVTGWGDAQLRDHPSDRPGAGPSRARVLGVRPSFGRAPGGVRGVVRRQGDRQTLRRSRGSVKSKTTRCCGRWVVRIATYGLPGAMRGRAPSSPSVAGVSTGRRCLIHVPGPFVHRGRGLCPRPCRGCTQNRCSIVHPRGDGGKGSAMARQGSSGPRAGRGRRPRYSGSRTPRPRASGSGCAVGAHLAPIRAPGAHSGPSVQMQIHVGARRVGSGLKCACGAQNQGFRFEMCRWEHIRTPSRALLLPRVRPRHT